MQSTTEASALTGHILGFLRAIGLRVEERAISGETFVPGITVEDGTLLIDHARLLFPGDLLHEAGHLAVLPPADRARAGADFGQDPGAELAAIAWSYAAALHLRIHPAVVFHPDGYRGWSPSLLENFQEGRYLGVPLLVWMQLTAPPDPREPTTGDANTYPHMRRWLRE